MNPTERLRELLKQRFDIPPSDPWQAFRELEKQIELQLDVLEEHIRMLEEKA